MADNNENSFILCCGVCVCRFNNLLRHWCVIDFADNLYTVFAVV